MAVPVVHLITERRLAKDLVARVSAALAGQPPGRVAVHLREKDLGGAALLALARPLAAACHAAGQLLIVNDRLDVALAAGRWTPSAPAAGGPPEDARRLLGPAALVGVSCHSVPDVVRARDAGASYATVSPIHDTPSKRAYGPPLGLSTLAEAARLGLPIVALGGMSPSNAPEAYAAGAHGVAAIRAWLAGDDPVGAVRALAPAGR